MPCNILILQGHPDAGSRHLCHALADAYAAGAEQGGHEVRRVEIATLDVPLLRSQKDWEEGAVPPALEPVQRDILWADHLVLLFPLWLGDMPALVKAFLEQVARPGFAIRREPGALLGQKLLAGRSARLVVTMGMPAPLYRWFFRAHAARLIGRNIFGFVGIRPMRASFVGGAGDLPARGFERWSRRMRRLGVLAA